MNIGFYAKYALREPLLLTLQLAEFCTRLGQVSVRTSGQVRDLVPDWTARLRKTNRKSFTRWVTDLDVLIWTTPGLVSQVSWAQRHNCTAVALVTDATWLNITGSGMARLPDYNQVLCLQQLEPRVTTLLRDRPTGLRWSPQLPVTQKDRSTGMVRCIMPLLHRTADLQPVIFWNSIFDVLAASSNVQLTMLYDLCGGAARRRMQFLAQRYPGRVSVKRASSRLMTLVELGAHDITWAPRFHDDYAGLVPMWSLHMGTPVLSYHDDRASECVQHGVTGHLLSADSLPVAMRGGEPHDALFTQAVGHVLRQPDYVRELAREHHGELSNRRAVFDKTIGVAIGYR